MYGQQTYEQLVKQNTHKKLSFQSIDTNQMLIEQLFAEDDNANSTQQCIQIKKSPIKQQQIQIQENIPPKKQQIIQAKKQEKLLNASLKVGQMQNSVILNKSNSQKKISSIKPTQKPNKQQYSQVQVGMRPSTAQGQYQMQISKIVSFDQNKPRPQSAFQASTFTKINSKPNTSVKARTHYKEVFNKEQLNETLRIQRYMNNFQKNYQDAIWKWNSINQNSIIQ